MKFLVLSGEKFRMASFYIAADAVIERDGKILMIEENKERAKHTWNIPGGAVEHGENPVEAVKREVWEETGLKVEKVEGLLGVAEGKATIDNHPIFVFVFSCTVENGEPEPEFDEEILDANFVEKDEIEGKKLRNDIILQALKMKENGTLDTENFKDYSHPYLDEEL